jgi:oligoribonuclease NrnB/cAMP/cGMP phosphodiesterase (DHH superfamily)
MILIYHHNDLDGQGAVFIAKKELTKKGKEVKCIEMDYDKDLPPIQDIKNVEEIYILDFSLKEKHMDFFVDNIGVDNIIWIDHHETAIKKLHRFKDIKGIRQEGTSGCMLTWHWFNGNEEVPYIVKLINDYDIWALKLEGTLDFYEYIRGIDLSDIENPWWDILMSCNKDDFKPMINEGKKFRDRKKIELRRTVDEIGIPLIVYINGVSHTCLKVNLSDTSSTSQMGSIINNDYHYDLAWMFYYKLSESGEFIRVNQLRSKITNVAEIAERHGGGGHPEAAGWTEVIRKEISNVI